MARLMPPPVVEISRLTKRFDDVVAVEDLSLTLEAGETLGFIGPNGAGKTTTIRVLLGLLRPSSGTALVFGRTGTDVETRRRIGYLPGDLALEPRWTVADHLGFFASLRPRIDPAWRDELLDRFDLDTSRRAEELSTGNRRKVGIVQALMHRPELLVLDEPTSGLDPLLQAEFAEIILDERSRGTTVFLSSHMLQEVERVAQRLVVMRDGRLAADATVEELRARARQHVDLQFEHPVDTTVLAAASGVVQCEARGRTVRVVVEGPVGPFLQAVAPLQPERISTPEAGLEEIFMDFYQ